MKKLQPPEAPETLTPFQTTCGIVAFRLLFYVHTGVEERLVTLDRALRKRGDHRTFQKWKRAQQTAWKRAQAKEQSKGSLIPPLTRSMGTHYGPRPSWKDLH